MSKEKIRVTGIYKCQLNTVDSMEIAISFEIDKKEGIRTGYITPYHNPGATIPHAFGNLNPNGDVVGVYWSISPRTFNHNLTEQEAALLVENEMARYDEILARSKELNAPPPPPKLQKTIVLRGEYKLTKAAQEKLFLSGAPAPARQEIEVELDALKALRTEYAEISVSGELIQIGTTFGLFAKLEPRRDIVGVSRPDFAPCKFDRLLSKEDAAQVVAKEMSRYGGVLQKSRKIIAARDEWIKKFGSQYLKKLAKGSKMFPDVNIIALYDKERLAIEFPGWDFISEKTIEKARSPREVPEDIIDAFTVLGEKHEGAQLIILDNDFGPNRFHAIMICPWTNRTITLCLKS